MLFLVLALYRLPADRLIAATLEGVSKGRILFEARQVSLVLPPGYRLEQVTCGLLRGDRVVKDRLETLTVAPRYGKLLTGSLPVAFEGRLAEGGLSGEAGISMIAGWEKGHFTLRCSDLRLEGLSSLRELSHREIKGRLQGEISLKGNLADLSKIDGEGRLSLSEGSIETTLDLPGLETVPFDTIQLAFRIRRGILSLEDGEMVGPMVSGRLSGEIELLRKVADSRIRIKAVLRPGPSLLRNDPAGRFLDKVRKGDEPIRIKIGGDFKRPTVALSKG